MFSAGDLKFVKLIHDDYLHNRKIEFRSKRKSSLNNHTEKTGLNTPRLCMYIHKCFLIK